jgi:D-amino peptidase
MKIYISVDLEGICGTTGWAEVTRNGEGYQEFQRQMTAEVAAACRGALAAGATEIVVRDAHDSACNLLAADLPQPTSLIRGWSRHPYMMMQELDSSYTAALMIGYHSYAGGGGSPLAHTMSSTRVTALTINQRPASEFLINWYTAILEKVPVVFLSGDAEICAHAGEITPAITTVAVKKGIGASTVNIHPQTAIEQIEAGVRRALKEIAPPARQLLPGQFRIETSYTTSQEAYRCAFYPGARMTSSRQVTFTADSWFEVLRFFLFTL